MVGVPASLAFANGVFAQAGDDGEAGKRGGTITVVAHPEPPNLVGVTSGSAVLFYGKATEGLLEYEFDLTPRGQLAESWEVSEDGLRYTFNLRKGVKWHDGVAFTSADVAWSIDALKQYHPRGRSTFANVTSIETPDEHTVVLVLEEPAPYMLRAFGATESPIVARHIYEGTDPATNPNINAPIGTGPFKFKEWVRGSHIIYERNPEYWGDPRPYVDTLIFKFIPDGQSRTIALETGEGDIAYRTTIPASQLERLEEIETLGFETRGYSYINNIFKLELNLDNPHFADLRVRQALSHAIDRQALIKIVLYGYGEECASPISPFVTEYYDPTPSPYPYDLAAAEKLLDEAGLPKGSDGTRFSFVLDVNPYVPDAQRFGEYFRAVFSRIGVNVEVRLQDAAGFTSRVYTDRNFDCALQTLSNLFDPTVGVQRLYWSQNFKPGVPFSNAMNYSNPRVDELLEGASVEVDTAKRKEMFLEFQKIVAEEVPSINLATVPYVTVYNKRVKDHTMSAEGIDGSLAYAYIEK